MYSESTSQVDEVLQIVKKRKWQILVPAVFVFCLSVVVAIVIPQKYHAESEFELRHVRVEGDWQFKESSSTSLEVMNADNHLTNHERVREVLEKLQWAEYENLKTEGTPQEAAANVGEYIKRQRKSIGVDKDIRERERKASAFVKVFYKHVDPEKAKEFLRTLVEMWANDLVARDEALLTAERDELQNHARRRERELNELLDEKGRLEQDLAVYSWADDNKPQITAKEDPYVQELTQVKIELNRRRTLLVARQTELDGLKERERSEPPQVNQQVKTQNTAATQNATRLQSEISSLRSQQVGLTALNKTWQRLQMEIEAKEEELELAQRAPTERILTEERVPNPVLGPLRERIEKLELEISSLLAEIEELGKRDRELFDLQKQRLAIKSQLDQLTPQIRVKEFLYEESEKTLQGKQDVLTALMRANKDPFHWTKKPATPAEPSEPNPVLIIAIGLAGGLALGLGSSMLAEFTKSCYRNVSDISAVMTIPVLGVVNRIVTRRERRAARMRGLVVLSSSAAMLFVIGWFTWAYTTRPEILPSSFLQQIEEIRSNFK